MQIHPVILSGGSGSRLWPLSREHYPKQLLALVGDETLLQQTVGRLDGLDGVSDPLIVCNEEHRFLIAEQCRALDKTPKDILLEPVGRNTAPALTLAALRLEQEEGEGLLLVMPADHVIRDTAAFHKAVAEAAELAQKGKLVTFGVVPRSAHTGYGYIKKGAGSGVEAFVEKPDRDTAARYVESGEYFWNSGMFLMSAPLWLEELGRHRPEIVQACRKALEAGNRDYDFFRVDREAFSACPSDSIDYAVMEKTGHTAVVPLDAGWSDVGAWSSLWEVSEQQEDGNVIRGDVFAVDTADSILISEDRLLATVGLRNAIVVETPDAVLVADKDKSQEVKEIVNRLKAENRTEFQAHRRVYRPWGCYDSVDTGPRFQVKRITVKPGAALSLQKHHHRAEHWVVVKGTARVTRGEEVIELTENQSTYIPIGMKHRLENPGKLPLEIIEVQSGSYLGEDDIVRYDDIYNRQEKN